MNIFEIKRMATHNGPGIRTMVHFKGCNLDCKWCSTPESKSCLPQISFSENRCIGCGVCVSECVENCITICANKASIDWRKCSNCLRCAAVCCSTAFSIIGREYTASEVLEELLKDKNLYGHSAGGVTFSGGEVLIQIDEELLALMKMLRAENITIGLDTAGCVEKAVIDQVLPYTDFFLWDIKIFDEILHEQLTGKSNRLILNNLKYVDRHNVDIYLRCPIITGVNDNDEHFMNLAQLARELKNLKEIHLFGLHHLGTSRYKKIGKVDPYENVDVIPTEYLETQSNRLNEKGFKTKIIGI